MSLHGDRSVRVVADVHGDVMSGMLAIFPCRLNVVFPSVNGSPVVLQPTAGEQLVEPLEPSQPAPVHEVDERRVDRAVGDRRPPAHSEPLDAPLPHPHAARRDDRERNTPLFTSIRSTPSRRPPRRVRLDTDQGNRRGRPRSSARREKLSTQRSCEASVSV